jgi:hypothetical protein
VAHNVELSESADRELGKLDVQQAKRILKFLHQRIAKVDDPRSIHFNHQYQARHPPTRQTLGPAIAEQRETDVGAESRYAAQMNVEQG